jgi:hypothetical protein
MSMRTFRVYGFHRQDRERLVYMIVDGDDRGGLRLTDEHCAFNIATRLAPDYVFYAALAVEGPIPDGASFASWRAWPIRTALTAGSVCGMH